jgi:nicotinate-nucleotide pyrophosphorylase (carboxylating)
MNNNGSLAQKSVQQIIDISLKEDISHGDITTDIFIPKGMVAKAHIVTHEKATIAGVEVVKQIFKKLDKNVVVRSCVKDGNIIPRETTIIEIQGNARALLRGERVALNFLSHLSAIATNTTAFIKKVHPYNIEIVDTRKTTPGLRLLEKAAIRCAKGVNHRFNLNEMVLIKDNHHLLSDLSVTDKIAKAKKKTRKLIGIEVENLIDFQEAWAAKPYLILLDNMTIPQIRQIVALAKKDKTPNKPILEVSGGINLGNIRAFAKTGIRRISIGALTHSKKAINISMEIVV